MHNDNKISHYLLILGLIFLGSCSITRHLEEGQSLLVKNTFDIITIDSIADKRDLKDEIADLAIQEPNEKMLGIWRIRLRIHNATRDTTRKFNRWLNKRGGEPPVILDQSMADQSVSNMQDYLLNKGYYNAEVSYSHEVKNKKSKLTYHVKMNGLTRVNAIHYEIADEQIKRLVLADLPNSPLKAGKPYDVEDILEERRNITLSLLNRGYYKFNKQYIQFEVDTLNAKNKVDLYVKIDPPKNESAHHRYNIRDIIIYPDFDLADTLTSTSPDTIKINEYHFIGRQLAYNPKAIMNAIFFRKGDLYSRERHQITVSRLTELGVFRFVNIQFREVKDADSQHQLDVVIRLLPSKKQELTFNFDVTTSSDYFLGSEIGVGYNNKNLFGQTDLFSVNANGGLELIPDTTVTGIALNTIDLNASASFYFPGFVVPFKLGRVSKWYNPKTHFTASYNYLRRLDLYTLNSTSFSYGFDWQQKNRKRHLLDPLVINFVKLADTSSLFNHTLEENPSLQKSFANQLIIGSNYTLIYSGKENTRKKHSWFVKTNIDVAGNLLYAGYSIFDKSNDGDAYKLLNRPFFQYVKPDAEVRYYLKTGKRTAMVYRLFGGIGIPWGNAEVLPYIKQYAIGGSNSIRAFRIRQLGPGAYKPEDQGISGRLADQTGDIKLETNIEYRFDLTSIFKGAIFIDAGNIWLLSDTTRPEGVFKGSEFYKQIAIGTGVGLRLDFSFFVLRMDLGIPIRDPAYEKHNGWRFSQFSGSNFKPFDRNWRKENLSLNLAVGYPF